MFRVSYFFRQQADLLTGWSCNFWNNLGSQELVEPRLEELRHALAGFTGYGSYITHARISDLDGFRQAKIFRYDPPIQTTTNQNDFSDYPDTAILLKLGGPKKVTVNQWIRGIREGNVNHVSGKLTFRATDQARFNEITALLLGANNGWCLRVRDGEQKLKDITNIMDDGVVTVLNHLYPEGSQVRIQRVKGFTYVNKLWKITGVTPTTFKLIGWNPPELHEPYLGGGLVRLNKYVDQAIQSALPDRASSHDSGRPFGLRGGRRKTRKK